MMIRNLEDLAHHIGADEATEASLDRRVYKDTRCGAWLKLVEHQPTKKVRRRFGVRFSDSIGGVALRGWKVRRSGARYLGAHEDIPPELADYLNLRRADDGRPTQFLADFQRLDELRAVREPNVWWSQGFSTDGMLSGTITLEVEEPHGKPRQGVLVGSIVEGTDVDVPGDELLFPFSVEQWDALIQSIEDAADEIWAETHGCEECNGTGEAGGPINPACQSCKGDGAIL